MDNKYVHGYDPRENIRLQDQASTLVELFHSTNPIIFSENMLILDNKFFM